jgi:Flp pilus assembly protein TadG
MTLKEFLGTKFRRGTVVLEIAFIAPVVVVVILGIVDIGRGVMVSSIVYNAANEGARIAILNGSTNADVTFAVQTSMNSALGICASDVAIEISTSPAPGNPDPANNVANCHSGDLINVVVQVSQSRVAFLSTKYFVGNLLVGRCSMQHE